MRRTRIMSIAEYHLHHQKYRRSKHKELALKIILMMIAVFLSAYLCAAVPETGNRVHVRQNVFALEGDSVYIEMEIGLNDAKVDSRSYVLLTPVLRAGSMEKELPSIQINGRNQHKAYKRLVSLNKENKAVTNYINASDKKVPQTYVYKTALPFEAWMEQAEFLLREDQCECSGPLVPMSFELLARNMENRNRPEQKPAYEPLLAVTFITPEVETIKKRMESGKAYLDYPVNVSAVRPEFRNNTTELQRIYNLIDNLKDNHDATITGVAILGYASPEGTYHANQLLSEKRAQALANHLKVKYGFADNLFQAEGKGEDWQTLDSLVAASNMKDKEQILAIIRGTGVFDGREKKLMELSGGTPYRDMLKEMFPKLRRSDYELSYTVVPFTVEQGKEVIKTRPSSLSLNEMFLIAKTYEPGSDAFNEVFETAARIFPQDYVANLNAAASALNRKDVQSAEKYLNKVTVQDAAYWNNAGVLSALKKEYEKAAEYFHKAQAAGNTQAAGNMKETKKAAERN